MVEGVLREQLLERLYADDSSSSDSVIDVAELQFMSGGQSGFSNVHTIEYEYEKRDKMLRDKIEELKAKLRAEKADSKTMATNLKRIERVNFDLKLASDEMQSMLKEKYQMVGGGDDDNGMAELMKNRELTGNQRRRDQNNLARMLENKAVAEDENDDGPIIFTANNGATFIARISNKLQEWQNKEPMAQISSNVERKEGSGVAAFFRFQRWMAWVKVLIVAVFTPLYALMTVQSLATKGITDFATLIGFSPQIFLYGSVPDNLLWLFLIPVVAFFFISMIAAGMKMISNTTAKREAEIKKEAQDANPFVMGTLAAWDWGQYKRAEVRTQQAAVAENLLILLHGTTNDVRQNSRLRRYVIRGIRTVAWGVLAVGLLFQWTVFIILSVFQDTISDVLQSFPLFTFFPPLQIVFELLAGNLVEIVLSVFNAAISKLIVLLTSWEFYTPAQYLKVLISRLYLSRILSILVVVAIQSQMLLQKAMVPQMATMLAQDCVQSHFGSTFIFLAVSESLSTRFMNIGTEILGMAVQVAKYLINLPFGLAKGKFEMLHIERSEFDIAVSTIDIIYIEALFFVAVPYAPWAALVCMLLAVFGFFMDFVFVRFFTDGVSVKWSPEETSSFFFIWYIITFVLCAVPVFVIWFSPPSGFRPPLTCGPLLASVHSDDTFRAVLTDLFDTNIVTTVIFNIFTDWMFLSMAAFVLFVLFQMKRLTNAVSAHHLSHHLTVTRRQMFILESRLRAKDRSILRLRSQLKIAADEAE